MMWSESIHTKSTCNLQFCLHKILENKDYSRVAWLLGNRRQGGSGAKEHKEAEETPADTLMEMLIIWTGVMAPWVHTHSKAHQCAV